MRSALSLSPVRKCWVPAAKCLSAVSISSLSFKRCNTQSSAGQPIGGLRDSRATQKSICDASAQLVWNPGPVLVTPERTNQSRTDEPNCLMVR